MRILSTLFLFVCGAAAAQEISVDLDPSASSVAFQLGAALHTVHGKFELKSGSATFDPASGKASGRLLVNVPSGNTGNSGRDRRMHEEILESGKYPDAVFTVDRITGKLAGAPESTVEVHGILELHGTGHEITLPVRVRMDGPKITASGAFTVPYVQWGLKNPSAAFLRVSEKAELKITLTGKIRSGN